MYFNAVKNGNSLQFAILSNILNLSVLVYIALIVSISCINWLVKYNALIIF